MKKIFKLENLDCANCALKIEDKIRKINGVLNVSVNFITQRFVLEANDELFDDVFEKARKIAVKVEPDLVINA